MNDLKWTGERFLPEVEGDVELEHMHRYFLTSKFAKDKAVLDIACGEGYGSNLLADFAVSVTGIDISQEAIQHAEARYGKKTNLFFIQGDCSSIPLKDSSMDLVVSFETIEHHDKHQEFLLEIKRVLKKDGVLIISTPDKKEYSDLTGHINEFHVKELYFSEFEKIIKENFKHYKMLGQRIRYGSYISSLQLDKEQPFVSYKKNNNGMIEEGQSFFNPLYYISIAGDKKVPHGISSLYEQPLTESELVNHLSNALKIKTEDYDRLSEDHDKLSGNHEKLKIELNLRIAEIERANITIEQKEAFIHAILNSTSWYITKPLRWARRKMTRLFNPNTEKPVKQTRIFFMIKKIQWVIGMIQSLGGGGSGR